MRRNQEGHKTPLRRRCFSIVKERQRRGGLISATLRGVTGGRPPYFKCGGRPRGPRGGGGKVLAANIPSPLKGG